MAIGIGGSGGAGGMARNLQHRGINGRHEMAARRNREEKGNDKAAIDVIWRGSLNIKCQAPLLKQISKENVIKERGKHGGIIYKWRIKSMQSTTAYQRSENKASARRGMAMK